MIFRHFFAIFGYYCRDCRQTLAYVAAFFSFTFIIAFCRLSFSSLLFITLY